MNIHPLLWRFLPCVGVSLIRSLGAVLNIQTRGASHIDGLYRDGKNMIIAFWHGQQFMMPLAYRGKHAHILISRHQDGELIWRILERFGFQAVRGSTTRGGVTALRELIQHGRSGSDLVVTPDGPKGPCHVAQSGIVHLAKKTGMPIVPLVFACSKKKSFPVGIAFSFHAL
ncbi:MAG: DUF374 domain-containing protein [Nitrospirales bacterium]|nr:DUF374 domain-containing protein [Nitrospirales bacterium]